MARSAEHRFILKLEEKAAKMRADVSGDSPATDMMAYRATLARIDELNETVKLARKIFGGDEDTEGDAT